MTQIDKLKYLFNITIDGLNQMSHDELIDKIIWLDEKCYDLQMANDECMRQ